MLMVDEHDLIRRKHLVDGISNVRQPSRLIDVGPPLVCLSAKQLQAVASARPGLRRPETAAPLVRLPIVRQPERPKPLLASPFHQG